jgi:hypothetical protein
MLKNIEAVNGVLVEKLRKKGQISSSGGRQEEKACSRNLKLTGLSNSGG